MSSGDIWAWYYKFEVAHGNATSQEQVVEKCKLAEPKHGQVWPSVAKDPKNSGMSIEEILKTVAGRLDKVAP